MRAPSEHTINGISYDVEVQMFHKSYDSQVYAAVSVFFDMVDGGNSANPFIDAMNLNLLTAKTPSIVSPSIPLINLI
jgi:carbonic anhydrase